MKLNLENLENSNIKYKISKFPDGQQDIVIENHTFPIKEVTIKSRFNSYLSSLSLEKT